MGDRAARVHRGDRPRHHRRRAHRRAPPPGHRHQPGLHRPLRGGAARATPPRAQPRRGRRHPPRRPLLRGRQCCPRSRPRLAAR